MGGEAREADGDVVVKHLAVGVVAGVLSPKGDGGV